MGRKESLMKAISWRLVASSDTFILAVVFSMFLDSLLLASVLALAEIPTKLLFYYLHERVWYKLLNRKG